MTDAIDKRLAAVEARAKVLGWTCTIGKVYLYLYPLCGHQVKWKHEICDIGLKFAERLLSLYKDGPVVEIKQDGGFIRCSADCGFMIPNSAETLHGLGIVIRMPLCIYSRKVLWHHEDNEPKYIDVPTETCPGVGSHRLMKMEDSDAR